MDAVYQDPLENLVSTLELAYMAPCVITSVIIATLFPMAFIVPSRERPNFILSLGSGATDKAPPSARNNSNATRKQERGYYPLIGDG